MIRKQVRERREYLYRKNLEAKQRATQQRRDVLKHALDTSTMIPTDLRKDAAEMVGDLAWGGQVDLVDDEYRWAGCEDPNLVVTTSRDPSSRLKMFAKEIKLLLPNSRRINRGGHDMKSIVEACTAHGVTDLILLSETRGVPDSMIVSHFPHGPTAYFSLSSVVMRHDIPNMPHMSEQYPHLIFHNITSPLGNRLTNILKYLFPVPKKDSNRVVTFANEEDFISFRQHTFKKDEHGDIELTELGPRFEMRPYCIILGTIDNADSSETEWALRSHINRKRRILTDERE
uniref:Brix domain-containing protein n=3 Tax=Meloidogyne TaxID=189290 RepID=A0A914MAG3_MELIC